MQHTTPFLSIVLLYWKTSTTIVLFPHDATVLSRFLGTNLEQSWKRKSALTRFLNGRKHYDHILPGGCRHPHAPSLPWILPAAKANTAKKLEFSKFATKLDISVSLPPHASQRLALLWRQAEVLFDAMVVLFWGWFLPLRRCKLICAKRNK